jgi:hypothetical protein
VTVAVDIAGYELLASITERALTAAGTNDADLLDRLLDDWSAAARDLPDAPPGHAGPALARAAAAHAQLGVLLRGARDEVGRELARNATGRRTAIGYGAGTAAVAASGMHAEHRA